MLYAGSAKLSRRTVLVALGGTGATIVFAACGAAPSPTTAPPAVTPTSATAAKPAKPTEATTPAPTAATRPLTKEQITLIFQGHVAGGEDEQRAYDQTLEAWHEQHPNITVEYNVIADPDRIPKVTAQLAANQAPDMWRHNAGVVRLFAHDGHLLDLTDRLPGYDQLFLPALMAYCLYKGRFWALPHTTDTSALFYREDALEAIGVKAPTNINESWTFEQFGEVCDKLVQSGKQQYAFTHNQGTGRWIPSFLYATGGKLVTPDFKKIAINAPEGIAALRFIKNWTDRKWAPEAVWTQSSLRNADVDPFIQGTTSMGILGQWNITYMAENIRDTFTWHVTFIPRDKVQATSLGGTPIVIWSKTQHPDEATAFFEFFVSPDMMRMFDEMANYLPVRLDLSEEKINYGTRPDLMQVFQDQVKFLPRDYVAYVGRSYSSGVGTIVREETTKMVASGQSPEDTARLIEERGNKYIQENPDVEDQ